MSLENSRTGMELVGLEQRGQGRMWEIKQKEVAHGQAGAGCSFWREGQLAGGISWEGAAPQDGGEALTPLRHTFLLGPAGQENREVQKMEKTVGWGRGITLKDIEEKGVDHLGCEVGVGFSWMVRGR